MQIIGIGTGRCGTASLAALMGVQHEPRPLLPWKPCHEMLRLNPAYYGMSAVSLYYLNYIDLILPDRVIVLKRNKEDCVASYMRKNKEHEAREKHWINPFNIHAPDIHSSKPDRAVWNHSFPKYDPEWPLEKCFNQFYDDYYRICEERGYEIFKTEQLNTPADFRLENTTSIFHLNKTKMEKREWNA